MNLSRPFRTFFSTLICLILLACSSSPPPESSPQPSPAATDQPALQTPQETAVLQQTPTREATQTSGPPLAVLVLTDASRWPGSEELQTDLAELAAADGLDFQVLPTLSIEDLPPNLRVAVVMPPDPGLAALANAAPHAQFLGIGIQGLEPGGNISVIEAQGASPDRIGFLAGYLAAVATPEWRAGAINIGDSPEGVAARQGFLNGVVYFCGLCRQTYPPYHTYPLYVEIPTGATQAEIQGAADLLVNQAVKTAFVAPGADSEELFTYLAEAGINLIGSNSPPAAVQDRWIASVGSEVLTSLRQVWPDLANGQGGARLTPSLEVRDVNPQLLSPGRQYLVKEFLADLQGGFIDPGVEQVAP